MIASGTSASPITQIVIRIGASRFPVRNSTSDRSDSTPSPKQTASNRKPTEAGFRLLMFPRAYSAGAGGQMTALSP